MILIFWTEEDITFRFFLDNKKVYHDLTIQQINIFDGDQK